MPFGSSGRSGVRRNIALGITPTVLGWDTAPSNLERVTDGDITTATGEGVVTTAGSTNTGYLFIEFDHNVTGLVCIALDAKVSTGFVSLFLNQYVDGVFGEYSRELYKTFDSAYNNRSVLPVFIRNASKIRLYFYASTALTLTAKFYEVAVYEVVL